MKAEAMWWLLQVTPQSVLMLQIWQPGLFSEQRMTVCNNAALAAAFIPPQGPLLEKCAANLFNFQFHPDYLQTEIALNSESLRISKAYC